MAGADSELRMVPVVLPSLYLWFPNSSWKYGHIVRGLSRRTVDLQLIVQDIGVPTTCLIILSSWLAIMVSAIAADTTCEGVPSMVTSGTTMVWGDLWYMKSSQHRLRRTLTPHFLHERQLSQAREHWKPGRCHPGTLANGCRIIVNNGQWNDW